MKRVRTKKRKMVERTIYGNCGDVVTIKSDLTEKEFIKLMKRTIENCGGQFAVIPSSQIM